MKASIGEIWLVLIPILSYDNEGNVNIKIQKRPCLIIDDGRGLIVEQDQRNYHILKLTTQNDPYQRKLIKNWRQLGLKKKSYVRIEMPIKLEEEQLDRKITELPTDELIKMYAEVYRILNVEALEKISKKYNDSKQKKTKKTRRSKIIKRSPYQRTFLI